MKTLLIYCLYPNYKSGHIVFVVTYSSTWSELSTGSMSMSVDTGLWLGSTCIDPFCNASSGKSKIIVQISECLSVSLVLQDVCRDPIVWSFHDIII